MAKTNTIPFPQNVQNPAVTIVNATSFTAANGGTAPTNTVLFSTAGANDSVLKSIQISSDDSIARTVQFWLSTDAGTTKYLIGTVPVAAFSGSASLINIDVLGNAILTGFAFDETGKPVLPLAANARIYVCIITAAVTATKTLYITGVQEDF